MPSHEERRAAYETAVRALAIEAERLLAEGLGERDVALEMVKRRNALKHEARREDDPTIVVLLEQRNLRKYGDPIGPGGDWLYEKYGSWRLVIEAACRPADLSGER